MTARMPSSLIGEIEAWADVHDTTPSEALRKLVEMGLSVYISTQPVNPRARTEAATLAEETTKDVPQWFWTDFEHVDQEPTAIKEGRPSIDPTTRGPNAPNGKDGVRNETAGSKWQYYRLRGVQLTFTDQFGRPIELANTLIEPLSSSPSSCITCHAKAAVSNRINHNSPGGPFMINSLAPEFVAGLPDPAAFQKDGQIEFLQTDFLWSLAFRARSEKPN